MHPESPGCKKRVWENLEVRGETIDQFAVHLALTGNGLCDRGFRDPDINGQLVRTEVARLEKEAEYLSVAELYSLALCAFPSTPGSVKSGRGEPMGRTG